MSKILSFHSSRGGTGKTIVATNLSALLAQKGFNVALIDLDFRAPSIHHVFSDTIKKPNNLWINDYLNSRCEPKDFLTNVSSTFDLKGDLLIGFANPSFKAIENMLGRSRAWEATALKKLFTLQNLLTKDFNIDFCILDTSPGIHYSSLNSLICSDQIVFVATSDPLDIAGIKTMVNEYKEIFENKTFILLNKAFPETDLLTNNEEELANHLPRNLKNPVIGTIPCYCDVLRTKRNRLLVLERPDHPFSRKLEEISHGLLGTER